MGNELHGKKLEKDTKIKEEPIQHINRPEKRKTKKYIDAELKIVDQEGVTNAQWWMQTVTAGEKLKTEKLKENEMKPKRKITMM